MVDQYFKVGDEVELKSGGPTMVVKGYEPKDGEFVTCEWYDKEYKERSFNQETLTKYTPPSPPKIRTIRKNF